MAPYIVKPIGTASFQSTTWMVDAAQGLVTTSGEWKRAVLGARIFLVWSWR